MSEMGDGVRRLIVAALCSLGLQSAASWSVEANDARTPASAAAREAYQSVDLPPGFQILPTELEGPVFANAEGKTLYKWPQLKLRNGYSGEAAGKPACYDELRTVTAGLMSPYPAGLKLPELDSRPTCTDLWPPVLADEDAQPTGDWSIIRRRDGTRQWAYREQPLYTSIRDLQPGDTFGGTRRSKSSGDNGDGDSPAGRVPVGPPPLLPPGFAVRTTSLGRLLTTDANYSVYAFDADTATSTACAASCLDSYAPVPAPQLARAFGEWSILERSPGVRQWVYRGSPLYTHKLDWDPWSQQGSDRPGWNNVYTQRAPEPPAVFTRQTTIAGEVLADADGMTIYTYQCGDDSIDQLACDHPEDTQVYRLAMCGGDAASCRKRWPYVEAAADAQSTSRAWRVVSIDPRSGRFADEGSSDALRVWAYRNRPVYTFWRDEKPTDVHGAGTGEWRGKRNGLFAFWLRDDYMNGVL